MVLGQHRTDFIRDAFDVRMIIHPPGMAIPLLQVLPGFSIAIQSPLFTVQDSEVWMDIRPKERFDGGRTVPVTVRLTAVMFLEADSMIAKDRMKTGSFVSVFLERVPTGGADMHARIQQETLFCYEYILYFS